jgi:hypothetical protein
VVRKYLIPRHRIRPPPCARSKWFWNNAFSPRRRPFPAHRPDLALSCWLLALRGAGDSPKLLMATFRADIRNHCDRVTTWGGGLFVDPSGSFLVSTTLMGCSITSAPQISHSILALALDAAETEGKDC